MTSVEPFWARPCGISSPRPRGSWLRRDGITAAGEATAAEFFGAGVDA